MARLAPPAAQRMNDDVRSILSGTVRQLGKIPNVFKVLYRTLAHTSVGRQRGIRASELSRNLRAESADSRTRAVFALVEAILTRSAERSEQEFAALREPGLNDGEIVDLIDYIGISATANYLNKITGTQIDYPLVRSTT